MGFWILSERAPFPLDEKQLLKKRNMIFLREEVVFHQVQWSRIVRERTAHIHRCKEVDRNTARKAYSTSPRTNPRLQHKNGMSSQWSFHKLSHLVQYLEYTSVSVSSSSSLPGKHQEIGPGGDRNDSLNSTVFQLWGSLYYSTRTRVMALTVLGSILLSSIQKKCQFQPKRSYITTKDTGWICCNLSRYCVEFMSFTEKI